MDKIILLSPLYQLRYFLFASNISSKAIKFYLDYTIAFSERWLLLRKNKFYRSTSYTRTKESKRILSELSFC
jgi:hypothetical protein